MTIRINWTETLKQCTNSDSRWFLDLDKGTVTREVVDADGNYIEDLIPMPFAHHSTQFQWMRDFIESVESPSLREALREVTSGAGAFSRFKRELSYHQLEKGRWLHYRMLQIRTVVEDWILTYDLDLTPPWKVPNAPLDLATIPTSVLRHEMKRRGQKTYEDAEKALLGTVQELREERNDARRLFEEACECAVMQGEDAEEFCPPWVQTDAWILRTKKHQ